MKNLHSGLWRTLVIAGVFAIFSPTAFAASPFANVIFDPNPALLNDQSATEIQISYELSPEGSDSIEVIEQIRDAENQVIYVFGEEGADLREPGTVELTWDGSTTNPETPFAPTGSYKFYLAVVDGNQQELSTGGIEVKTVPTESMQVNIKTQQNFTSDKDAFFLEYLISDGVADQGLDLSFEIVNQEDPQKKRTINLNIDSDGDHTMIWTKTLDDGSEAPLGVYDYTITVSGELDGMPFNTVLAQGVIDYTEPLVIPVASGLYADPDPYNPNAGNLTLGFTLSNIEDTPTINTKIYLKDNPEDIIIEIPDWELQVDGVNQIIWNGQDSDGNLVEDGEYVFSVSGVSSMVEIEEKLLYFQVETSEVATSCAGYTDLEPDDPDCEAIEYVQSLGAMTGYPDGSFGPDDILLRDQVAKIILMTFNQFDDEVDYCQDEAAFPDVTDDQWSYQYICRGVELGIITGYASGEDAGFYRPGRQVNRVEFLALLLRNLTEEMPADTESSYVDVPLEQWFTGFAKFSKDSNLFEGNELKPTNYTTRREVAQIIYKLYIAEKI